MIDVEQLSGYIDQQGFKHGYVARVLGIAPNTLRLKLRGEKDFKVSEADKLAHLLELTREERDGCFFAPDVYWTTPLPRRTPGPKPRSERSRP